MVAAPASLSTPDAILAAAAAEFAASGYRATTMQTIARVAGCTPPTLYAHFGSKKGIFEALVARVTTELYAVLARELPNGLTLSQHLELRIGALLELAARERDVFVIFIVRPYDLPDVDPERESQDHELLHGYWRVLFEAHVAELGDRSVEEASLLVEGVLYSFVSAWLRSGEPAPAQARRIVELILSGVAPRT